MKIRYNLGRGVRYKTWKITDNNGKVINLPETENLTLFGAQLKNRKASAQEIFNGGQKRVCSWIEFDSFRYGALISEEEQVRQVITYNPRVRPYWTDSFGNDLDDMLFNTIIIENKRLSILHPKVK